MTYVSDFSDHLFLCVTKGDGDDSWTGHDVFLEELELNQKIYLPMGFVNYQRVEDDKGKISPHFVSMVRFVTEDGSLSSFFEHDNNKCCLVEKDHIKIATNRATIMHYITKKSLDKQCESRNKEKKRLAKKEEFRKGLITCDSYHLYLPYDISFFNCLKRADDEKVKFLVPNGKTSPSSVAEEETNFHFGLF